MNKKMKLLILASFLALGSTPLLYVGGLNNNPGIIAAGFAIFCLGMGMVLFLKLFSKPEKAETPPSDGGKTS